jgi:tRNA 2-selenouridine synthase
MSAIDLQQLLASAPAFIDVRAPAEFEQGAVPGAVNLPILTDAERHQVGLTYKTAGQAQAVSQGERLVSGSIKQARVDAWADFARQQTNVWIYCWRGGMRSQIAQQWLNDRELSVRRVPGGFKALRSCCLSILEHAPLKKPWVILGGRTGSGKTQIIRQRQESIDLEGLANHRGSAFGAQPGGQPTPINFENCLAMAFSRHSTGMLLLEDESRTIGRLALPEAWYLHMQQAPVVILETTLTERVANITREYVHEPLASGHDPGNSGSDSSRTDKT